MSPAATLAAVRKRHISLESLPETIVVPAFASLGRNAAVKSIVDATLDDIAFAVRGLEDEFNALGDRLHALRRLYGLARQAGALGAHGAAQAILAGQGGR
jgi:hypothetical protein